MRATMPADSSRSIIRCAVVKATPRLSASLVTVSERILAPPPRARSGPRHDFVLERDVRRD